MKKIIMILACFFLIIVSGCFGGEETKEETKTDNNQDERRVIRIEDHSDLAGVDPLIDRYPGSVRGSCVVGVFCIYMAEAEIADVIKFYRDIATERGNPWFYEEIPEEHPHWMNTYDDPANPKPGQFALTLGEAEDVCLNCVEWVLYAFEWPEE